VSTVLPPPTQPPPELPERPAAAGPAPPQGNGRWRPWTGPAALVAALVIALTGGLVVAVVAALLGADLDGDLPPGALLASTAIQQAGFIAAAVIFARMAGPTAAAQFGLRRPNGIWRAVGIAFAVYVAYALFTGVWSQLVPIEAEDQLDDLGIDGSTAALVAGLLVVCVGAPVAEEFLFRGYVFAALRNWRGPWLAAVLTGAVFGAIHLGGSPAGALVPLAVLGAGLCLIYQWTGSLYPCVALHAINNGIAFGVMQDWGAATVLVAAGATTVCALLLVPVARRWTGPRPAPAPAAPAPSSAPA
jgi:hypothetical protein